MQLPSSPNRAVPRSRATLLQTAAELEENNMVLRRVNEFIVSVVPPVATTTGGTGPKTGQDASLIFQLEPHMARGSSLTLINPPPHATAPAVHHGVVYAAQMGRPTINVTSLKTGDVVGVLPSARANISCLTLVSALILVAGTVEGTIIWYNLATGQSFVDAEEHLGAVLVIKASADGLRMASGSSEGFVKVWDVPRALSRACSSPLDIFDVDTISANPLIAELILDGPITDLALTTSIRAKQFLAVATLHRCHLYNADSGARIATFHLAAAPRLLALDPAVRWLYIALVDGGIQFVNITGLSIYASDLPIPAKGEYYIAPPPRTMNNDPDTSIDAAPTALALAADGTRLLTGYATGALGLFDIPSRSFRGVIHQVAGSITGIVPFNATMPCNVKIPERRTATTQHNTSDGSQPLILSMTAKNQPTSQATRVLALLRPVPAVPDLRMFLSEGLMAPDPTPAITPEEEAPDLGLDGPFNGPETDRAMTDAQAKEIAWLEKVLRGLKGMAVPRVIGKGFDADGDGDTEGEDVEEMEEVDDDDEEGEEGEKILLVGLDEN